MKITKLTLDGFGRFDDTFALELPGGSALIVGDNETGKSTIVAAVGAVLFGLAGESEKARYAPFGLTSPHAASLEIETKGKRHRFTRNFKTNHVVVEMLGDTNKVLFDGSAKPGGRTDEKERYNRLMQTMFGLDSRELFDNSVFVEQGNLPAKMQTVVRRIVSGSASADYAIVLRELKETCENLTVAVPWKNKRKLGRIEVLEAELTAEKDSLAQVERNVGAINDLKKRLSAAESKLKENRKNVEQNKASEKDLLAFSAAISNKARLEEELNRCRRQREDVTRLVSEIENCSRCLSEDYSDYSALPQRAEREIAGLSSLQERLRETEERAQQAEKLAVSSIRRACYYAVAISLGAALVLGYGLTSPEGVMRLAAILAGSAIAAGALISVVFALRAHAMRQAETAELGNQAKTLKGQIQRIEADYPFVAGRTVEDILRQLSQFRRLCIEKEKKEEALKQHPDLKEIESRYDSLSNELIVARNELDGLKARRPSLADVEAEGRAGALLEKLGSDIARLEREKEALEKELRDLDKELGRAEATQNVSIEALEEEIQERESNLERLKLSREAHLLAVKVLDEAVAEFRASHLERIQRKTSEYLARITGAPCLVSLSDELEPQQIERNEERLSSDQLSWGMRDQLYFALRLAAIEEICGDCALPIILDDPFVNFDETRLKATLDMLEKLAESHQIILLTHDKRYANWREPACYLRK